MAKVKINRQGVRQFGSTVPYGNLTTLVFALTTIASGAAADSNSTAALGIGDVVDLGSLPEGMRLEDASIFVTTGMTATVTGSLGFKYEDGVDDTTVPQDEAYFVADATIDTAGRYRANTGKLIVLPKPARLILTTAVTANAKISDIKVLVSGELKGFR